MKIGLNGAASTVDRMVEQAVEAESDGFATLWYPSAVQGDPLVAIALVGRATTRIELGTSVLQTYTSHPALMANRAQSVAGAMGRAGFTLGIGPSHEPVIEGSFGLSFEHAGRHTEEYVTILCALLRGEAVEFHGEEYDVRLGAPPGAGDPPVPVLVAALGPRLLRVGGAVADGTILWMANARAVATHVAPRITAAAAAAGRPAPRIVAGLPVAVHDDVDEARETAAKQFAMYGTLPNYRRILDHGGVDSPADAAIVGDEATVTAELQALLDAGATDLWAAIFPVGDDREGSRRRTRALLRDLANS
ncbi:MAG TPA: TIGR03564 family F420-dependent LLM class oxidoreductase [Acidimicrobiia bacterium]|nr:TIGR03564 family F420-dependent LLM class oxidoreductase [Acidimicrobiia bacterium]